MSTEHVLAPTGLGHYLAMWNASEPTVIRSHLRRAVTDEVLFVDPNDWVEGADALGRLVAEQRRRLPDASFSVTSEVDGHHGRYRYHWRRTATGTPDLDGFDVTSVGSDGRIVRVDGFFGVLRR